MIPLSGCQQCQPDNPATPAGDHNGNAAPTARSGTRSWAMTKEGWLKGRRYHCGQSVSPQLTEQKRPPIYAAHAAGETHGLASGSAALAR